MTVITLEQIRNLYGMRGKNCVSLFMPTTFVAVDYMENTARLKNLITRADRMLSEEGVRKAERDALLAPARSTLEDIFFQVNQKSGLAMFATNGFFKAYKLPVQFEEEAVVSGRFHLKPLLKLVSGNGRYYVLAVSKHSVRLFQGSRFTLNEINVKDLPESIESALRYDQPELSLQYHTSDSAKTEGRRPVIHHGQGYGVGNDQTEEKKKLSRYFRKIDAALTGWL